MLPHLRFFIACWSNPPAPTPHDYRLRDIRTMLLLRPGTSFPAVFRDVLFYALMTGARGSYEFAIRVRHGVGPGSAIVWEGAPIRMNLGTNPLTVHAVPIRERAVPFPQVGQYDIILLCDGSELSPSFYLEVRG